MLPILANLTRSRRELRMENKRAIRELGSLLRNSNNH